MADRVKIPRDLGEHGRRLFRPVVREVADAALVLTSTEEIWLHYAAEMTDRAAELREQLRDAPRMVRGSQGIIKINGANPQRAGAHKRWKGAGA